MKARPVWLRALVAVDDAIARVEGVLVVASIALILALYFLYVFFRNVSASLGEKWLVETSLHLVLWVTFFGAALAARRGRHISVDLAPRLLTGKALHAVRILTHVFAVAVSGVLAYAAWRYMTTVELAEGAARSQIIVSFGATSIAKIPSWWFLAAAPVGLALTAWHFLVLTIREIVGDGPEESGEAIALPQESGEGGAP